MISSALEALYICDSYNEPIFEHVYRSRPASARTILPLYLAHPSPRPAVMQLSNINPPTILYSIRYADALFLSPVSVDTEALFVLEFLHRAVDVLEEFLGAPLLASKIEGAYDVVAQLVGEMVDAGLVCNTEPNALRDDVEISGWMGKLLGVGLSSQSPAINPNGALRQQLGSNSTSSAPAIPWRKANVRHTSNELYVDIIETLSVTLAPSGRPLAAFANGSILFTSKISGIPDLLLSLSSAGGKLGIGKTMELPVFHPCVRLSRWKENPGELSFVPPDGKFMLAGYEVNLMPSDLNFDSWFKANLQLPVSVELSKSLGSVGADFEVRLVLDSFAGGATGSAPRRPPSTPLGSGRSTPNIFAPTQSPSGPVLQNIVATVPLPPTIRNIQDIRASRGEAFYTAATNSIEWRVPTRDAAAPGTANLRCTVVGQIEDDEDDNNNDEIDTSREVPASKFDYDENADAYQSSALPAPVAVAAQNKPMVEGRNERKVAQYARLMPSSATVSFSVKGWLASGIKVSSLTVDTKKSRGLGEGVKPYKGVKYLTVSKRGVETRC